MRRFLVSLSLCAAAFVGASASSHAQDLEGRYESTELDGSKIYEGYSIYIDVEYQSTDDEGIEHYVTKSIIVKDETGEIVKRGNPGSIEWDADVGDGVATGSTGIEGFCWENGDGSLVVDYQNNGGNARLWTPTVDGP